MIELGFASAIVPNMDYEAPFWDFADIMFTPKIFGLKETAAAGLGGFPFAKKTGGRPSGHSGNIFEVM